MYRVYVNGLNSTMVRLKPVIIGSYEGSNFARLNSTMVRLKRN